jgi:hypothetical protein
MLVENMYENANKPQRGDMLVENMYENANKPQRGDMLKCWTNFLQNHNFLYQHIVPMGLIR